MFTCSICDESFEKPKSLRSHTKIHNSKKQSREKRPSEQEGRVNCDVCDNQYLTEEKLAQHKTRCHDKSKECSTCGKQFGYAFQLKNHIQFVHEKTRSFKCSLCDKAYKTKTHLKEHFSSIHETFTKKCDHCDKIYNKRQSLNVHIKRVHIKKDEADVLNLNCDECQKHFDTYENLRRHKVRMHNKNKQCNLCTKKFGNSSYLKETH